MSWSELLAKSSTLLAVCLTLVQVAPIKINPWSWIAQTVGRALNGELFKKIDSLEKKADDLEKEFTNMRREVAEKEAIACRTRILRFGDEVFHEKKYSNERFRYSKEHFNQVLRDITDYEQYCSEHPDFENNQAALTCARIKEIYGDLLVSGGFL